MIQTGPNLQPGGAGTMAADTGWTANSTTGDKTAQLVTYAGGGITSTMITALNTVSSGLGTYLATMDATVALLVKKVAALETALVANKVPNA
jgi:hypothetical protein